MIRPIESEPGLQIETIKIPLTGYDPAKFPDLFAHIHFDRPFLLICDSRINPVFIKKIQDILHPEKIILYDRPEDRPIIGDQPVLYFEIE